MTRTLGMELVGFDPLEFFSPEQIELIRSMKVNATDGVGRHRKSRFGTLIDSSLNTELRDVLHRTRKD
jgi:hypothetical protein